MSPEAPSFSLGAEWEGKIRVGLLSMSPVRVQPTEGDLADEIESHAADLLRRFGGVAPAQIESLAAAQQSGPSAALGNATQPPPRGPNRPSDNAGLSVVMVVLDTGDWCGVRASWRSC